MLCDFDGTITEEDVCLRLLAEFAEGDWQQLETDYANGRIGLEECLAAEVAMFKAPREVMADFARQHARLRRGFADFVAYCRGREVALAVVSAGLDFYVDAILAREGLNDLDVTCIGTTVNGGRIVLSLPLGGRATREGYADFKVAMVRERQAQGKRVVFVGDGSTDFAAARRADRVFARDKLLAYCRREGIACTPFEDFRDLRLELERLL